MITRTRISEDVLAVVLAGGEGQRLMPLTRDRSKPAVPFGGRYRIIDFVLSNLTNSGIERIYVLTQYKAQSLLEHLQRAWIRMAGRDAFVVAVPAQMQQGRDWYQGTANAVLQNLHLLRRTPHRVVAVFGADHVYKMNVAQMVEFHRIRRADVTVACLTVPVAEASAFGVLEVDAQGRVVGFEEKPKSPRPLPEDPELALVSMGNYLFAPEVLESALSDGGDGQESSDDFGRDILPRLISDRAVFAYDFRRNRIPREREWERAYWRDIGSIDAYFEANLDLKNVQPRLNLYNWEWPIRTSSHADPPAKFVFDDTGRRGEAVQSVVSGGSIFAGGRVKDSVIGRNVFVDAGARVENCVLLDNVHVGVGVRLDHCIVDKNVVIPDGTQIGPDTGLLIDGAIRSPAGVTVIPRAVPHLEHADAREY